MMSTLINCKSRISLHIYAIGDLCEGSAKISELALVNTHVRRHINKQFGN